MARITDSSKAVVVVLDLEISIRVTQLAVVPSVVKYLPELLVCVGRASKTTQLKLPLVSDDNIYPFPAATAVGNVKVYDPLAGAARVTIPAPAWFNGIGI
jgi:hypothetical protein